MVGKPAIAEGRKPSFIGNPPAPPTDSLDCHWCGKPFVRPSAKKVHERFCREGPAFKERR